MAHIAGSHNVLITGPLGHIGSQLIRHLDRSVFSGTITLLDNLESRRFPSLYGLPRDIRFTFIEDDVLTADFGRLLEDVGTVVSGGQVGKMSWKYQQNLPQFLNVSKALGKKGHSRAVDLLAEMDRRAKSGLGDAADNVEQFILSFAMNA